MVSASRPTREDYYRALADSLPEETLVVTALGNASYLWAAMRDAPENFYLEDAMGLALPLALGLAVAQPDRKVVVVEGDGGCLAQLPVVAHPLAPPQTHGPPCGYQRASVARQH